MASPWLILTPAQIWKLEGRCGERLWALRFIDASLCEAAPLDGGFSSLLRVFIYTTQQDQKCGFFEILLCLSNHHLSRQLCKPHGNLLKTSSLLQRRNANSKHPFGCLFGGQRGCRHLICGVLITMQLSPSQVVLEGKIHAPPFPLPPVPGCASCCILATDCCISPPGKLPFASCHLFLVLQNAEALSISLCSNTGWVSF